MGLRASERAAAAGKMGREYAKEGKGGAFLSIQATHNGGADAQTYRRLGRNNGLNNAKNRLRPKAKPVFND